MTVLARPGDAPRPLLSLALLRAGILRRRAALADLRGREDGNALVEFLGAAVVLMIPTLYLVLTLGRVQAAAFATQGAAKDAGRALSIAETVEDGAARAEAVVGVALADQGFGEVDPGSALTVECSTPRCLEPGSEVATTVRVEVGLPGLGGASWLPLSVPVSARVVTPVDQFKDAP